MAGKRIDGPKFFAGDGLATLIPRLAKPRKTPKKNAQAIRDAFGGVLGPELCRWLDFMDSHAMEKPMARLELRGPHTDDLSALVSHNDRADWIAELQGFFCGVSIIAQEDDEMSYQAAWDAFPDGSCQVVYAHQDEWGAFHVDRSITSWLCERMTEEPEDEDEDSGMARIDGEEAKALTSARQAFLKSWPAKARKKDALEVFHERTLWLTHVFTGIGDEWGNDLAKAATYADWKKESELATQKPNLAAYWLWSHWLLQNDSDLEALLKATASLKHPVVKESRKVLENLQKGKAVKVAKLDQVHFYGIREELADIAPSSLLSPERRKQGPQKSADSQTQDASEKSLLAELKKAASTDQQLAESLKLMEMLQTNRHDILAWSRVDSSEEDATNRLVELVDARHLPLLKLKVSVAAKYKDGHKKASPGMILALAKAGGSFEEFEKTINESGTTHYGLNRNYELAKAYGSFAHPRATAWLEKRAKAFLKAILADTWQRQEPQSAFTAFIRRDTDSARQLLAQFLETVTVDGGSWHLCAEASQRAGELGLPMFANGLARMFEERLGANDGKMRSALARAYARVAPQAARELLTKQVAQARNKEYPYHEWPSLSGLLVCAPEQVKNDAAALLDQARNKRSPSLDVIFELAAILRGIAASPDKSLAELARPWVTHVFTEDEQTQNANQRIQELAREAVEKCGRPLVNQ